MRGAGNLRALRACAVLAAAGLVLAAAAGANAEPVIDSFFDVYTEMTIGPPYPSEPPIGIHVLKEETDPVHLYDLKVSMASVEPVTSELCLQAETSGGGGGAVTQTLTDLGGNFNIDSFFDIYYEIEPFAAGPVAKVRTTERFHVDSFFDITYEIDFADGGMAHLEIHGEIEPTQPLTIDDIDSLPDIGMEHAESFFDIFFEIDVQGAPDPSQPLLHMDLTGWYFPEPTTLALLGLGAVAALRKRR